MHSLLTYSLLATGTGALYLLIASGILIVHRGSGILNFAQGTYVMFGVYLFHQMRLRGAPLSLAFVLTVAAVSALGGATYGLVVRPLDNASLVSKIVATLGVVIVLTELANLLWASGGTVEAVLPRRSIRLFNAAVTEDQYLLLAIAVACAAVLWAVYRFTTLGLATAAVSENRLAAASFGWSPNVIATLSWALAGAVAGIAAVLIYPVQGALDTTSLTLNVVPALAVALVASLRSFPIAALAALILAAVQQWLSGALITPHRGYQGVQELLPLLAIVIVLSMRGDRLPARGQRAERRPLLGIGTLHPIAVGVAIAVAIVATWALLPTDWVAQVGLQATYAVLVLSLVVVLGYAGQLSLGQMAMAGIAALIAGRLVATQGWSFGPALIVGVVGAAATGALFALPALRTRGVSLGVITLSLGAAVYELLFTRTYYSPAPKGTIAGFGVSPFGTVINRVSFFGINLTPTAHPKAYTTFCIVVCALVALVVLSLRRGTAGRRLIAVRTNERAAASLGISVSVAKFYAFVLSAGIAGLGGVLLAFRESPISYTDDYNPLQSIYAVGFAVIGGVGSIIGALISAVFFPGTVGAAAGHDLSNWMGNIGHPRPWITALISAAIVVPVARRAVAQMRVWWATALVLVAAVAVGAALSHPIGSVLSDLNKHFAVAPWIAALALGSIVRAVAVAVGRRWPLPPWAPLAALVAGTVIIRFAFSGDLSRWMVNVSRYLPLLGGVTVIAMLLQHGDGLAAGACRAARRLFVRDAVSVDAASLGQGESAPASPAHGAGAELALRDVSVAFGGVLAVDGMSIDLHPGEIVGLIGPNGAGKTTLIDALTGYARLQTGEILLDGQRIDGLVAHRRARLGIARTFQNLELFDDLTVLENLATATDAHRMRDYVTTLVRPGRLRLAPVAVAAIRDFNLVDSISERVDTLPHGLRRLVAVARALATGPSVILLDEPAAGLDEAESAEFAGLVRALAKERGLSVLVIEHDMSFIMSLCDRIVVMDYGRKIAEGAPAEVQGNSAVIDAYLGTSGEAAVAVVSVETPAIATEGVQ